MEKEDRGDSLISAYMQRNTITETIAEKNKHNGYSLQESNAKGSLVKESPMQESLTYHILLSSLHELPFSVGKKLLFDFLHGNRTNESIEKHKLYNLGSFSALNNIKINELENALQTNIINNFIEWTPLQSNRFIKVLTLTAQGRKEINNPTLSKMKKSIHAAIQQTEITEQDKFLFEQFDFFLNRYNDFQKKAILSPAKEILCIAAAGSGKTTTITQRIAFLTTYRSVQPQKILAVTFTRKAKQELEKRLSQNQITNGVQIETFNSFCEKILKQYNDRIYSKQVRVITYGDRIRLVKYALSKKNLILEKAIAMYFSTAQQRGKSGEELAAIFVNDCFFILDHYKNENKHLEDFSKESIRGEYTEYSLKEINNARMMYDICKIIETKIHEEGLRDFADQIMECINFLQHNKECIPQFEHILIDEFQDINKIQMELVELLHPDNIFCVGDPRQAIFGWRGSKIKYILEFYNRYQQAEIITLTENYRSSSAIVSIINKTIKSMQLPNLTSGKIYIADKQELQQKTQRPIVLLEFASIDEEYLFIQHSLQSLLEKAEIAPYEIFVLARTNRILKELSQRLQLQGIKHILRTDEIRNPAAAKGDEITLATIHAIKGLEAHTVFVIGCTTNNFPCRTTDHPVMEMIKVDEYDKEEEERRLFYVALSRAKEQLILTYSGTMSYFITPEMLQLLDKRTTTKTEDKKDKDIIRELDTSYNTAYKTNKNNAGYARLKQWRSEIARTNGIPAYMVINDRTILDLLEKMPAELRDLEDIYGLGPNKIKRYGRELLRLVNDN
ncbi:ATP-dependent DNA helicase UvrD2 [Candidatus Woesearchaeota archaeon]|nr:ATP-dependent DNA helicase UvrD2 [Candidatus Woesearchaeota archaeon]